jgi:hypothetical protein
VFQIEGRASRKPQGEMSLILSSPSYGGFLAPQSLGLTTGLFFFSDHILLFWLKLL